MVFNTKNQQVKQADAATRERQKTTAQRAEDISYTLNHAIACTVTDWIDGYYGAKIQEQMGIRFGCGHDHEIKGIFGLKGAWIPIIAEFIGDLIAVPITIGLQRNTPGFMDGLHKVLLPIFGPFFKAGAFLASAFWAADNQVSFNSKERKQKAEEIYQHEVRHLPQAFIWTASSISANVLTQRYVLRSTSKLPHIVAGKLGGSAISTALVVALRAIFPQKARTWDQMTGEHIFVPLTKKTGNLFGVTAEDVERMAAKQDGSEASPLARIGSFQDKLKAERSKIPQIAALAAH